MKTEHDSSGMIGLGHVGMYAKDPASLAEFYRDVMGCKSLAAVMRVTHSVRLLS
jgi:predicted enzyme related to lactoylglutathione lyase